MENINYNVTEFVALTKEIKSLEGKIKPIKNQISELKEQKKDYKLEIEKFAVDQNLGDTTFNLDRNKGHLTLREKRTPIPITRPFLKKKLELFFKEGPGKLAEFETFDTETKVSKTLNFILEGEDVPVRITHTLTCKLRDD